MRSPTPSRPKRPRSKRPSQPLDKAATRALLLLSAIILGMLLLGSQTLVKVREFSWANKAVSADDVAFMMVFTQPVEPKSVEKSLKIEPELPGKFSWSGRRMAYTLEAPAPYGESYQVSLSDAEAIHSKAGFEPFDREFSTRDRIFAYIGAEGEENGRVVMFNFTRKEKTLLTPADQTVLSFKVYPERDRILYLATPAQTNEDTLAFPALYSITTGLETEEPAPKWQVWNRSIEATPAGEVEVVLDSQDYQNLKFDLSPNGELIVIQRVNQQNPADFGPWVLEKNQEPRKLKTEPGGDFRIAPDSISLLLQQGEGTAIIALTEEPSDTAKSGELLDFLPDYGLTLDIASDGSAAALVNFNQDDPEKQFTQTLFWVSNRGEEKPLLETDGAILSAQFNESNEILYCLVNRLVESESEAESESEEKDYLVVPYLTAVNVETGQEKRLLEMPPQPEITVSLAPDGLAILFDEALASEPSAGNPEGEAASATHRLWLLPLFSTPEERLRAEPTPLSPTALEITGRQPMWLP